ncbi:RNA 2'-phosphotransferase [Flavobacterium branchiophilum]|uniref:Probable RNA 2'-phosphotransferase n=1 Tax=Flavobacterium branchiophilum (strain FL-15) TaxID=1034807 RepID=G2Z1V9_FLABF|nr:RNA 2'-phosphotransferase [Flavobacterium branchiophilum]CCB69897.1 RNA 2'-phosphotransferase [Flavobacterium branchiophilum FL-15]
MNEKENKNTSKFLSLVLRHAPETIDLALDENGWANVAELIEKCNKNHNKIDFDNLVTIVETNDKKRFAFNEDQTKIRANQGHSIEVDLNLKEVTPPDILYHGTVASALSEIKEFGLKKMSRQHVHLSKDIETAIKVGARRGKPIILEIDSKRMKDENFIFYVSENGVWLTDAVPSQFIKLLNEN